MMKRTREERAKRRLHMRIAVVDDNPMNVTVVQEILKRAGYTDIIPLLSGKELFAKLGLNAQGEEREKQEHVAHGIDLILLDMMMPGVDGIAVCRAIAASERLRDIPIIMVTAVGDSKKLAEALDAGAIDYVTKPINRIELLARIRVALRLKEQMDWQKDRDKRVREELQLAREVQGAALPQPVDDEAVAIDAIYRPSEELSGDLYAWTRLEGNRYGVAVIDAMGHGLSSSLVCMFIASILKEAMTTLVEPEQVVHELNRRAQQLQFADLLIQYYFTGVYMVLDLDKGTMDYINAGHPPGMIIRGDGSVETLPQGGMAIGIFEQIHTQQHTIPIAPGDRIMLVTDGTLELVGGTDEDQLERLKAALGALGCGVPREQVEQTLFQADTASRADDLCLVMVDIRA